MTDPYIVKIAEREARKGRQYVFQAARRHRRELWPNQEDPVLVEARLERLERQARMNRMMERALESLRRFGENFGGSPS